MPTNRPFFANFFSTFRARTNPTFQAKSSASPSTIVSSSHNSSVHTSTTATVATTSGPRTIAAKTATEPSTQQPQHATIASPTQKQPTSPFSQNTTTHFYAPPLSRSPGTSSPNGPYSNAHTNHNLSISPPGTSTPMTRGRQRRGSDSSNSSGGFMDYGDKWYIGGMTAGGDETFYRLGLVTSGAGKRVRSLDRLSL